MSAPPPRPGCRMLLGLDGSDSSFRALDYAVGAARRLDAALLAAYVRPVLPPRLSEQVAVDGFIHDQSALIDQLRREVAAACSAVGVQHLFVVPIGDPFVELKRLAVAHGVDAVLVGAAEQAVHRLLPSVASRLVRAAHWPVTVVP